MLDGAPTHVLLFIGDGMGPEQVRAAGYHVNGAEGTLSFESFPYSGDVTTYSADNAVTDSAAAATALATAQKVNNGVISMAFPGDGSELETALESYQSLGWSTGLVTTTYMTHATPAAFGAHEPSRNNNSNIGADYFNQTQPDVLFGGGANGVSVAAAQGAGYTVVTDRAQMQALDTETATMVSGQFGSTHLPYEFDGVGTLPHLSEMTETALAILDNDPDGLFLMVEGGRIDHAGHSNDIARNVDETEEFANAVQMGLDWAAGRTDTLIIVTADHETGGLTVLSGSAAGGIPTVSWTTTGHTDANVPVYAWGVNAELVSGTMDNTDIYGVMTTDVRGPQVVAATPEGVVNGSVRSVTVTFDEAIADGTFTLDDIAAFTGPGGATLEATAVNKLTDTQYEITFGVAELTDTDPNQTSPSGTYRWRDIDDNLYAASYKASYDYSNPEVSVEIDFEPVGTTFNGSLTATGLKPNFLYQVKLIGQPYRGDTGQPYTYNDPANESIGYSGRWWQQEWDGAAWGGGQNLNDNGDGSSPNPNDLVYQDRFDDPDIIGGSPTTLRYLYEGYMPFDYFITDEDGDAALDFNVDSAYHVMWKEGQVRVHTPDDGPIKTGVFDPDPSSPAYDVNYAAASVDTYGEWERLPLGDITLPDGEYDAKFFLTEESFHGSGGTDSGNWAAAVAAEIHFTIGDEPAGQYDLTIGPNIEDLAGNLMNQDGDLVDGEALADQYTVSFTVNTAAPEVVSPIPDVAVDEDDPDTVIDLSLVFDDADLGSGDSLTYSVSFDTSIADIVGQIDEASYTHVHQDLLYTHTGDNRGFGIEHDLARDNIFDWFESLGLQTSLEPFEYNLQTFYNIVGTKPGTTNPDDIFIVGAHYDSVHNPGADDNASGTTAIMEAARVLSSYDFENTITFIGFGREEQQLIGSTAYVAAHSSDNILGMLNLDMIGYNPADPNQNTANVFDWVTGGNAKQDVIDAFAAYGNGVTAIDAGQTSRSDHRPFEEQGFDSAGITEYNVWNNPYYHLPTDAVETPGYIDYTYATNITTAATGYLATSAVPTDSTGLLTATINVDQLTLDYLPDRNGIVEITVRATDTGGLFVEDVFLVTVTPLGDEPVMTAALDDVTGPVSAPEMNIDLAAHFFDADAIPNGDWLTFSVTGNTNATLVTTIIDGDNLALSYEPGLDGVATITVQATDASGTPVVVDVFDVTVDVNEPQVEIILDNTHSGVTLTGSWSSSSFNDTRYNVDYLHDANLGKGAKSVTYTPVLMSRAYNVYVWHPYRISHASNVPVDIVYSGGSDTVTVDQTAPGGDWILLGTYMFDAGTSGTVTIRTDATDGFVIADAVRFTPVAGQVPPVAVDDDYDAIEDTLLSVNAANGVLDNDTDANGDPLEADLVDDALHGTLTLNLDGSFTYDPDAAYTGEDTFTYRPWDGTDFGNTATVTLTVSSVVPAEVVLDNGDAGVVVSGAWSTSSFNDTRFGADYLHDANTGKGTKSVTYTPTLAAATYDVYIWHPYRSTHATNVPVDITHSTATVTVTVDQTAPGGTWLLLGTYDFDTGTSGNVVIRTDATDGYVIADAVKFTPNTGGPAEVIVDNNDPAVTVTGSWSTSSFNSTRYGTNYLHDNNTDKGAKSVTYAPTLNAGTYDVYIWHPYRSTHATNAPVDITHSTATDTVTVDQTAPGGTWLLLGTYNFDAGTSGDVTIRTDATDGYVMADAVKFTPNTGGPVEVIVDNNDTAVTVTGSWSTSSFNDTRYGANYLHDGNTDKGAKSVTYAPTLAAATYDVYIWHPYRSTHATNVPIDITYAGGLVDTVTVDQTAPGGTWILLGTYAFDAGSTGTVTIRTDGTDGYVIADAIKFTPV